jgi:hypothetical protein
MNHRLRRIGGAALPAAIAIVALAGCSAPFVGAKANPASSPDPRQAMLRFAQCMREHGIDLPDPSSDGGITIQKSADSAAPPEPNDPRFEAAQSACQKFMPTGGKGSMTSQDAKANQEKGLKFAQCMRQHGLTDFPDPQSNPGGGTTFKSGPPPAGGGATGGMSINGQSFSGFDPSSPEFQKAEEACLPILGVKGRPTTRSGGPGMSSGGPSVSSGGR